jgi:hypothetical protein
MLVGVAPIRLQQLYFGATFGASADRGLTPFLAAVGTGDIELVKLLLAHGANARLATADGRGAINMAVSRAIGQGRGGFSAPGGAPGAAGRGPASRSLRLEAPHQQAPLRVARRLRAPPALPDQPVPR